ncbi:hypothetical protein M3Y99_01737400 [Aphelenchoides fujianensis]|nr:hypothetical protein M3Y99_01737400 [Aphelenchoides fujianensis]
MDLKKDPLRSLLMAADPQQKRRTSPFMQLFVGGRCTLCNREFRGLKASNGKRHLEMKHPAEYAQILAQKRAGRSAAAASASADGAPRPRPPKIAKLNSMVTASLASLIQHPPVSMPESSSLSSTVGSSTDDDDGAASTAEDAILIVDSPPPPSASTSTSTVASVPAGGAHDQQVQKSPVDDLLLQHRGLELIDDEIKRCVIALEAAARPLRRLSLFAATFGISADFVENKHFYELFKTVAQIPLPTPLELEHQINLEISDVLLRIHRLLNSLPCGFCVSADVFTSSTADGAKSVTMGIVAHYWNEERACAEVAALDMIQLQEAPTLEFVAETLKHAFDKTDLNANRIYRTVVESSVDQRPRFLAPERAAQFDPSLLRMNERNYSPLFVGSCAAFRLRTTVDDVFAADHEAIAVREKVFALLTQLSKSTDFFDEWRQRTGADFLLPAALNWHSVGPVYESVLAHSELLDELCARRSIPALPKADRSALAVFLSLSGTIEAFAKRLEDERDATSSLLFPGLKRLLHELKTSTLNPRLSHVLRTALCSRFVDVLTSADEDGGDPFYLTAALLNPAVAPAMRSYEHVASRSVRTICLRILGAAHPLLQKSGVVLHSPTTPPTPSALPFGLGSSSSSSASSARSEDALDREIADYLRRAFGGAPADGGGDPFGFWRRESRRFEILAAVARAVLVVPATSAGGARLLVAMRAEQNGGREAWKRAILTFNDSFITI